MSNFSRNILRFIIVILIQVLILNQISLRWWGTPISGAPPFTPYLYPIIILLLPINLKTSYTLILGFATGLVVDAFMDTGGMHALASLVLAAVRVPIISLFLPGKLSDYDTITPDRSEISWPSFLTFTSILLLIHHIVYFTVEVWSFSAFGYLLLKILFTLLTSLLFLIIYTLLFSRLNRNSSR